ncbi:MAG TPA: pilus assembly PilX N-terminal domain-containing protein [Thermodesulfovibrionales bacterium]|nr:pilus assembly PilX N-terminal domain-containing protein [Thermodesulfovibrionales bacterium]
MNRVRRDERGIALVMALILSFIVLATVSALLYILTQGTTMSGYQKRYETSLEAAKGGVDVITKDIMPSTIATVWSVTPAPSAALAASKATIVNEYQSGAYQLNMTFLPGTSTNCMLAKLGTTTKQGPTDNWLNAGCTSDNESSLLKKSDGTVIADMQFTLPGPTPALNYNVYTKIVDTVGCDPAKVNCPNTSTSGLDLSGSGTVESGSGMVTPKHVPFVYRIELQAERQTNPDEHANLSVLYAY